jgi:hypothetical protein
MKKWLAKKFIKWADRLDPEHVARIPKVDGYHSGKVGIGFVISSEEIKKCAAKDMISYSNASKKLIAEAKERINQGIFLRIEKDSLIENKVQFLKDGTKIEGWIRIYVKEKTGKKTVS